MVDVVPHPDQRGITGPFVADTSQASAYSPGPDEFKPAPSAVGTCEAGLILASMIPLV